MPEGILHNHEKRISQRSSDGEHVSILRLASVEVIKLANASTKTFEVGNDRESPTCVSFIDDASLLVTESHGCTRLQSSSIVCAI